MKKLFAESFGTFCLVFAGTGAIVVNDVSGGSISHVGIALTFGLVVLAMIYAVGDISGAHLNPAVTLAFFVARRLDGRHVLPYIASQLAGAVAASGLLPRPVPHAYDTWCHVASWLCRAVIRARDRSDRDAHVRHPQRVHGL